MKTPLLAVAALAAAVSPLAAQTEALSASAAAQFRAVTAVIAPFQFVRVSAAAAALRAAGVRSQAVTVLDIERLYDAGGKVAKSDVTGWFSGRRYSAKGAAAQLLIGADILRDADAGSLGGSDFKLTSIGGAEPSEGTPSDLFDNPGSPLVNDIEFNIHEEAAKWAAAQFRDDGVEGQDTRGAFQVRKNGDLLVAKYADGTYAYFFKRVK